jgi:predicted SAM-dependent methyltransferase
MLHGRCLAPPKGRIIITVENTITSIHQIFIRRKGLRKAAELSRSTAPISLDLGCGPTKRPGFVGIDLSETADVRWDLRWGLPFADNTIAEIRSDHFLEHLELPMVVTVLSECHRALRSGGSLDFTVPHFDPYLDAYLRHDFEFLKENIYDVPRDQEDLYDTCFDRIIWLLYRDGGHQSMFDTESILAKVRLAGFTSVTTREYDSTRDVNQRFSSIYVVAIK